ncbi:MAG: hypothetical protein ACNS62_17645 [Candidatus Cyclobacteriaceae bacterium M3_2C_046]
MNKLNKILMLLLVISSLSCEECNDCGIVAEDPFVRLNFNAMLTQKATEVTITAINGIRQADFSPALVDTASVFRLPLSPVDTRSEIILEYLELSDAIEGQNAFTDTLIIEYDTIFYEAAENIYKMRAENLNVVQHSFDSLAPASVSPNQSSNEITLKVYF